MIPVPTSWKCYSSRVGLIENKFLDTFDFNHFGISRAEAIEMDPTHRILLEICEEALGDASLLSLLSKDDESKPVIGVFVGQTNNEWINRNLENVGSYTGVGVAQSMAANRISYTFGLTGPSVVIDSACSSSLVAVHSAVLAIKNGDCDIAIVASADIIISSFSLQVCFEYHIL
jgi:acyl transferase domain-containing protein